MYKTEKLQCSSENDVAYKVKSFLNGLPVNTTVISVSVFYNPDCNSSSKHFAIIVYKENA